MEQHLKDLKLKLSALREDRTRYVTATEVIGLYRDFMGTVTDASKEDLDKNKVLIDKTILLFSLSFITVGLTRHITAQYARSVTLRTLFMFLIMDPAFTFKELQVLKASIDRLTDAASSDDDDESSVPVIPLVKERVCALITEIKGWYEKVSSVLAQLPEADWPIHNQVIHLRRDILAEIISPEFSKTRLQQLSSKLTKIQSHLETTEQKVSPIVEYQINKALTLVDWFHNGVSITSLELEDEKLKPVFETLRTTLSETNVFVLTRRWTLRCSDLYERMVSLLNMEPLLLANADCPSRLTHPTGPITVDPSHKYWYLCTYVARRTWALIFRLLDTTEPVSESLSSIYNQLLTMRRCLVEVQDAGVSNMKELYPYQMKLDSIDRLREDGKFVVNGEMPPGQGLLNGLLAQCYDMILELEVEISEQHHGGDSDNDEYEGYTDSDACSRVTTSADSLRSDFYEHSGAASPAEERDSYFHGDDHTEEDHLADVPDAKE